MSDKQAIIETVGTLHDSLLLLVDRLGFILDELEQDQQGPILDTIETGQNRTNPDNVPTCPRTGQDTPLKGVSGVRVCPAKNEKEN